MLLKVLGLRSIAFPAIGAGVAGIPYDEVAVNMAATIVDDLSQTPESFQVTIYLFDRFGRMQPIDFIRFFEEFAARTRGLGDAAPAKSQPFHRAGPKRPKSTRKTAASETRSGILADLNALDQERQRLEGRLAQYSGALPRAEVREVETRLKGIQERRVALLSAVNPRPSSAVSVFVSYSHADEKLRKHLGRHLSVLEKQGIIQSWHDRMVGAGTDWTGVIDSRLNEARVILLLISADFINSKYCYDIEMRRALELHDTRQALVVPVILKPVSLKGTPLAKFQALPKDAKPVVTWTNRESAFVDITDGLRDAIQDLMGAA